VPHFANDAGFLQALIDTVPSLLFVVDPDVRVLHFNHAASRLIGLEKEAVLMKKGGDVLHCIYAGETLEGCGHSNTCPDCVLRNFVYKAFSGEAVNNEPVEMKLGSHGNVEDVCFSVTANTFLYHEKEFMLLMLEDITKQKTIEEKLRKISVTDELTGLYNRRGFFALSEQVLRLAKRQNAPIFMLYIDFDGLKEINDTFGHREGDLALVDVAGILKATYRESDIIGRIGGDEFAIIPIGTSEDSIEKNITRLQINIDDLNASGLRRYRLSVSCGESRYDPEQPCSLDELLAQADRQMYEKKRNKKNSRFNVSL